MTGIEKDILHLVSRIRCMTETQVGKFFGMRRRYYRKPFKKTLRKMCNEYTLRKYPCNINYSGYKENSYVYYLNGSKIHKGKDLIKVVIGSEIAIRIETGGYEVKRFSRNVNVDDEKYDLFIEYVDNNNDVRQMLIDIDLDNRVNLSKYKNLRYKIENSTIPFFEVPKVLVVTSSNTSKLSLENFDCDIDFIDLNLNKLFKYI